METMTNKLIEMKKERKKHPIWQEVGKKQSIFIYWYKNFEIIFRLSKLLINICLSDQTTNRMQKCMYC